MKCWKIIQSELKKSVKIIRKYIYYNLLKFSEILIIFFILFWDVLSHCYISFLKLEEKTPDKLTMCLCCVVWLFFHILNININMISQKIFFMTESQCFGLNLHKKHDKSDKWIFIELRTIVLFFFNNLSLYYYCVV